MKTTLLNKQTKHPLALIQLQKLTDWLSHKLHKATAPQAWAEVCVILLDDEGIAQPNREYFSKDRPTDVITFRYDPIPGEPADFTGDILINVERAFNEGSCRGNVDRELALYIAHGFDHLTGADDNTPENRKKMRATENGWLREASAADLIRDFIPEEQLKPE